MDDILTAHASRSNNQNKTPTSDRFIFLKDVTTLWDTFSINWKRKSENINTEKQHVCFMLLSNTTLNFHHDVEVIFLPTSP